MTRLGLAFWLALALLAPACALAAEPSNEAAPIRVVAQTYENRFPTSVRFTLKAEGDASITKATLYYKEGDEAITSYAPARFAPGESVSAEYLLDLRRNYQPPGVELRYQWRIEDEAGHKVNSEWASFVLDDPRFTWQVGRAENVELRWYSGGEAFGAPLVEAAAAALTKLRNEAGVEVSRPIKVYIYGSDADFQSALDPGANEWAGGSAFVKEGVIMIAAPPQALSYARRTLPHELSHVVVYQATKNPYGGPPTWLDEGLAMVAEGSLQPNFDRTLKAAVRDNRLISAWALGSSFPTDATAAELSYAESYSLVKFVADRYGRDGISRLLAQFREGATYDDALQAALGLDTYGLDDAWRASLGLKPVPAAVAATPAPTLTALPTSTLAAAMTVGPTPTPAAATATRPPSPTAVPSPASGATSLGCAAPALALVGVGCGVGVVRRKRAA